MTDKFLTRGYPPALLKESRAPPSRAQRNNTKRIPFVHTFHPFTYIIHKAIRRNWSLLSAAHPDVSGFRQPFLPCFKRAPNIKDNLEKADNGPKLLPREKQCFLHRPKMGTFQCLHCAQCNNVLKGKKLIYPLSGKGFKVQGFFTCDSSFVVYIIKFPCGMLYMGETSQPIRDRISKHKSTIRCKNLLLPIPNYFITKGYNISSSDIKLLNMYHPHVEAATGLAVDSASGGTLVHIMDLLKYFFPHTTFPLSLKKVQYEPKQRAIVCMGELAKMAADGQISRTIEDGGSSRIDFAFVSPTEAVGTLSEKVVPYSDHLALCFCLGTSNCPDIGRGLWKLNSSLLDDAYVQSRVYSLIQLHLDRLNVIKQLNP
ncbi:unnamed protein product, partial [Ranitomeya imitator]